MVPVPLQALHWIRGPGFLPIRNLLANGATERRRWKGELSAGQERLCIRTSLLKLTSQLMDFSAQSHLFEPERDSWPRNVQDTSDVVLLCTEFIPEDVGEGFCFVAGVLGDHFSLQVQCIGVYQFFKYFKYLNDVAARKVEWH